MAQTIVHPDDRILDARCYPLRSTLADRALRNYIANVPIKQLACSHHGI
jgi:hypothetical protein